VKRRLAARDVRARESRFLKSQREHPRRELKLRTLAWKLAMREISRSCSVVAAVKSDGPGKLPTCAAIPRRWRWYWRALPKMRERLLAERHQHLSEVAESTERHSAHMADSASDEPTPEAGTELSFGANRRAPQNRGGPRTNCARDLPHLRADRRPHSRRALASCAWEARCKRSETGIGKERSRMSALPLR
jgi:hypothetical protein